MKLIVKYNRANAIATVIVLLLSAICYYFFIRAVLVHQLDKNVKVEEREITNYAKENNQLPEPTNYKDEQEEFLPATDAKTLRTFSTINIFNKQQDENVSYRQLQFGVNAGNKKYKIVIRRSLEETEDLIQLILTISLAIALILLVSLFLINRFLLSKLWKPFNSTLHQIKKFNLSGKEKIDLEDSDINEFKELNDAVNIMTNQVSQDYEEIKNFTENASHEIQTPLAIIKSKLELLSQSENLKEEQMDTIQSIYETTNRLSKLNQSLILLTKIENRQFTENDEVDISDITSKHLNNFEELITAKQINLSKDIKADVKLIINEDLAQILIVNLITNAIKHNYDDGCIQITLTTQSLNIFNTGIPLISNPSALFERFKKDKVTSDSLGLGLSIVKKICDRYNFDIKYSYADSIHATTINF